MNAAAKSEKKVKRDMRTLRLRVEAVEVTQERNPYKYASDYGNNYNEPMFLTAKVTARQDDGRTVYFSHRLEFSRSTGLSNGDFFYKKESDFFRVEEQETKTHLSHTPELFPNAIAFSHQNEVHTLVKAGDEIEVVANYVEKTSKAGRPYVQLTHVTRKS